MELASQRIEDVKAALQTQMQQLAEGAQQAVAQVKDASQNLGVQSDILRANLASSESALVEAASTVREEAKHLPAALNRGVADIETAARVLKTQATESDQSLIGTADRFISVTSAARDNMVDEMQRVSSVADEADKVLRHFNHDAGRTSLGDASKHVMLSSEQKDLVEKAGAASPLWQRPANACRSCAAKRQ